MQRQRDLLKEKSKAIEAQRKAELKSETEKQMMAASSLHNFKEVLKNENNKKKKELIGNFMLTSTRFEGKENFNLENFEMKNSDVQEEKDFEKLNMVRQKLASQRKQHLERKNA